MSEERTKQEKILGKMDSLRGLVFALKPLDRSSLDRHYAIVLTDLEKMIAYVEKYLKEN